MLHHEFSNCHLGCEPPKREQPTYCGKVNTAGMGEYYSTHGCPPHPGYNIPPVKPLFVPGMSTQEQIGILAGKVDEMVNLLGKYDEKVWGAYDEIVNACICNDAYYSEIETEVGYLPATSAKYTVVHVPFVDRSNEPIRLQLGLAYDNTTNSGLHENVFDASERKLADKLFPAMNIADKWTGKVYWKGAPLNSDDTESFTLGVLKNGFIKVYNQTATTADMNKDSVENAMGVAGVLISGGEKTPDNYGYTDGTVAMVGVGMNYDTQERFFIMVDGEQAVGVTSGGGCTADQLADLFKKYGCTVAVLLAYKESVCGLDCGEMLNIPYDSSHIPYVPQLNAYWYITKEEHYHNDYVKEVAKLMQKYGRSIWTGVINGKTLDAVRSELADVESQLSQEIQDRKDGDTALGERIDELGERVTNLYNEVVTSIENEASAREEADRALGKRIDQEITDREKAVTDEANARIEADKALEESGNTVAGRLNQEIEDRKKAVEAEEIARNEADGEILQTMITNVKNLEEADKTLQSNIDKEVSDRQSGDTALQSAIDTLRSDYNAFKTSTSTDLETKTSQITQILADISSVKNIIAGVQATQSEIDETLTAVQSALSTMEQSFENLKQVVANLQTSWEQYKTDMNTQWSEFKTTVEQSLSTVESDLKSWVNEQLDSYYKLEPDKPMTKILLPNSSINELSVSYIGKTSLYYQNNKSLGMVFNYNSNTNKGLYIGTDTSGQGRYLQLGSFNGTPSFHPQSTSAEVYITKLSVSSICGTSSNVVSISKTDSSDIGKIKAYLCDGTIKGTYVEVKTGVVNLHFSDDSSDPVLLHNVKTPVADVDAVNKKYVDDLISSIPTGNYIPLTGTTLDNPVTGDITFKVNGVTSSDHFGIVGVTQGDFRNYTDGYADTYFAYKTTQNGLHFNEVATSSGGYNGKHITIDGIGSIGLATGTSTSSSAVTSTVGITTDGYVQITSNNPSGEAVGQLTVENNEINVHNNYLTNVKTPVSNTDGANKEYVDGKYAHREVYMIFTPSETIPANSTVRYTFSRIFDKSYKNIVSSAIDLTKFNVGEADYPYLEVSHFYRNYYDSEEQEYQVTVYVTIRNNSSSAITIADKSTITCHTLWSNN